MAPSAGMLAALVVLVVVGIVQGQDRPTGLSAVHTTNTTITVYWTPPTVIPTTGYEITYFVGEEDTTGFIMSVGGGSTDNAEIPGLNATVMYRVSIVSVNGANRSDPPTGPALAARGPGLAHKGAVFLNHDVIGKDTPGVGEDEDALYCVTDDVTCCGTPPSPNCCGTSNPSVTLTGDGGSGNGQGNWTFPAGVQLASGTTNVFRWYTRWLTGAALMNFRGLETQGTAGLHRCDIQDSTGTLHQFYTCIYDSGNSCEVTLTDPLEFSLMSALTADPPVFTLTCVSTGGPATTVIWTQDGDNVSYDANHVLTQTVTSQLSITYSNVLTVTGREPGDYICSVANVRTPAPQVSASLTVAAADRPTDITATRDPPTATSITVSWSVPSTGATPTGYIIHYQADGDAGSMTINSGATTTAMIAVPSTELVYVITMQTLSTMLPSARSSTITSGRVGLYFMSDAVPNHGIVTLDQIGTMDNAVQCWATATDCCTASSNGTGDWFTPNDVMLPSTSTNGLYTVKGQSNVFLQRNTGGTQGLYRCVIAASDGGTDTYYVGLFDSISGAPDVVSPIQFSLETSFEVDPPVFTLTCNSTGGPATTVNWTRDGAAVSYDDNNVLTQIVTDQLNIVYSNVLTVIGREPGNYTCSVTNDRGNDSSQVVLVEGADPPTDVNAEQFGTVLSVSWTPPTTGATPTGYVVCSGNLSNVTIDNGSASQQTFTISEVGVAHSVSVVTLSSQLPSAAATSTSTVLTAGPPTSLSAVHETPTSIHVYWTAPTGSITGYEITVQSEGSNSSVLVSRNVSDHTIDIGVSSEVDYSVSIVSLNSIARSPSTDPVLAARGPGLALKGTMFPNHGVLERDPSVIGEDGNALYCVTDNITCCGTPPSPDCCGTPSSLTGDGGSGNGQGDWYFPISTQLSSGTDNGNLWYTSWLTGAVLINFRGTTTTGTTGLHRCDILNSAGTLHQFYTCVYDNTDASQCIPVISAAITFSLIEPLSPQFTLTCVSNGGPAMTVTWTRDGAAVSYDDSHMLTQTVTDQFNITYSNVLTVTGREPGNYTCSVANERGNASSQILTVEEADMPVISIVSVNSTAVMFSWMLEGTDGAGPTGFVLYYDSDEMTPMNETIDSAVRQYTLSNLQPGVTLSITLVALSEYLPRAADTINVVLMFQSVRIVAPQVLTVGQRATLTCSSDFFDDVISSIQWFFTDNDSIAENMSVLTFNPTTDNLNGVNYTCRVTDTNNTVYMESVLLLVQVPSSPITVMISPVSGSAIADEAYSLICSVTEEITGLTGTPSVQWIGPDGTTLVPTTGSMSNQTSSSVVLSFEPVTTYSGGLYICLATLPSPAVTGDITANTSQAVVVEISSPSVIITADVSGTAGTSHEFTCSITAAEAVDTFVTAEVTWSGPGVESGRDNTTSFMDSSNMFTSTLQLSPLNTSDAGLYNCNAMLSPAGDSTFITSSTAGIDSQSLDVTALTAPVVTIDTAGSSTAGEMLTLTCRVTVVEGLTVQPDVVWLDSGGSPVMSGVNDVTIGNVMRNGEESTRGLVFNSLHTSHGEQYTCRATVNVPLIGVSGLNGSSSHNVTIQIPPPLVILSASRSGSLSAGTPLTLTCTTTLSQFVDDGVEVNTVWTGPAMTELNSGVRIIITNEVDPTTPYVSELTIHLLNDAVDNGEHNCTVTVTPDSGRKSFVSASTMVSQEHIVEVMALTAPMVAVDTPSLTTTGEVLILMCRVTVVEGLTVQPDVVWLDFEGDPVMSGVNHVTVGIVMRNDTESILGLQFSPLHTSHGGQYTCRATIDIQSIGISDLSGNSSHNVMVQILPPSSVVISASQSGSLSAGTPLTLTCTTIMSQFVNDGEEVTTMWTGPALSSGSRINITNAMDSISPYVSELTISPLDAIMDSGEYSCSVTVNPRPGRENVASTPVIEGQMVSVTALNAPVVTIDTVGTPTAGEMLTLTCRVTVVEGLTVQPDVEWVDPASMVIISGSESTLDLEFRPLYTSHGGMYTCIASIDIPLISVIDLSNSFSENVIVQISLQPPTLARDGSSSLRHGDSAMLTCSVTLDLAVDTAVTLTVRHTGPDSTDITNTTTAVVLSGPHDFSYRVTPSEAGIFTFTCTVVAVDVTTSTFITDSTERMATTIVTIALAVSIIPLNTDALLGENQYRAASQLTLSCQATGATGALTYMWTSTCTGCAVADTVSGQNVSVSYRGSPIFNFLRPVDAGVYTCSASDSANMGNDSTDVNIVGIGAYLQENSGGPRVLTNNALVTPSNDAIGNFHLRLQCISNSSRTGMTVGNVISYDGSILMIGEDNNQVYVGLDGSHSGRLQVFNPAGETHIPIDSTRQGVYTCQVYDASDKLLLFNVGIYPNGFNTSPSISKPSFLFQQTVLAVNCTSTGSVASSVTWTKDGEPVEIDGIKNLLTQDITSRAASTYDNVLTVNAQPGETAGNYCCSVTNAVGSASRCVEVTGVSVERVPDPLVLGIDGTLMCSTQLDVISIQWQDSLNSTLVVDTTGNKSLSLSLGNISDTLHNTVYTCRVVTTGLVFQATVTISTTVPPDSILVNVTAAGSIVAGDEYSLTCTVTKSNAGLTGSPSAEWIGPNGGSVLSASDITVESLLSDSMASSVRLTFARLHTSFSGLYTCQGVVPSPAVEGGVTASNNSTVTVKIPSPDVDVAVPTDPLYVGTAWDLTCTITVMPEVVDSNVTVEVMWAGPAVSSGRFYQSLAAELSPRSGVYQANLTIAPLSSSDNNINYICTVTVKPVEGFVDIVASDPAMATGNIITVNELPNPIVMIDPVGSGDAGEMYTLICSVDVQNGLVIPPLTEWLDSTGTVLISANGTCLNMTFNPLNTSNGGQYTCRSTVNIPAAGIINLSSNAMADVIVQVRPSITFSTSPSLPDIDLPYAGVLFNLTCTVELSAAVDTAVNVSREWTRGDIALPVDSRIMVSPLSMTSERVYQSSITFNPLSNQGSSGDSGIYSCSSTVASTTYIVGIELMQSQTITVQEPAPTSVEINDSGVPEGGQEYNLTCQVTVVEGLIVEPAVDWFQGGTPINGSNANYILSEAETEGTVTSRTLTFRPLHTSMAGMYECRGRVVVSSVGISDATNSSSFLLVVKAPAPSVTVSVGRNGTLYAGTTFALNCDISLDPSVDTVVTTRAVWSGPGGDISTSDIRFVISDANNTVPGSLTNQMHRGSLMFRPLGTIDSGVYDCSVVVVEQTQRVDQSEPGLGSVDITVLDLPPPNVTTTTSGILTVGQSFTLSCTVETVEFLFVVPTIEWIQTPGKLRKSMTTTSLQLMLEPLASSDGGSYLCRASVNIPSVNVSISADRTVEVIIQIPSPAVAVAGAPMPYAGTVVTLNCTIQVDRNVNTPFNVTREWRKEGVALIVDNSGCINISEVTSTMDKFTYETSLTFAPLRSMDDAGEYTCSVIVSSTPQMYIRPNSNNATFELTDLDLPPPTMKYSASSGPVVVGEPYSITCSATIIIDNVLGGNPTVQWISPNGSVISTAVPSVSIGNVTMAGQSTSRQLIFSSFTATQAGMYICQGCFDVPKASVQDNCANITVDTTLFDSCPTTAVRELIVDSARSASRISWREPANTGGTIAGYEVELRMYVLTNAGADETVSKENITLGAQETSLSLTRVSLDGTVPYEVSVRAFIVACYGVSDVSIPFFSEEGAPSSVGGVNIIREGTTITVSWRLLSLTEAKGIVTGYTVTYSVSESRRRQSNVQSVGPDTSSVEITDVDANAAYAVGVTATNNAGTSTLITSPAPPPIPTPVPTSGPSSPIGAIVGAIIAVVLAIVVIVVIVVIIVLVMRSRRSGGISIKTKQVYSPAEHSQLHELQPASLKRLIAAEEKKESYEMEEVKVPLEDTSPLDDEMPVEAEAGAVPVPIPVSVSEVTDRSMPVSTISFRDHVRKMHNDRDKGFEQEYQSLGSDPVAAHQIAKMANNRPKNRFANIFPYDHSRVVLKTLPGEEGSDYINACYLDGYQRKSCYIAAQGPMPTSLGDFWRMMWENRLPNIVILTKCLEAGRRKCEKYWADSIGEDFVTPDNRLIVTTTSIMPLADFEIRTFTVKSKMESSEEPLRVTQYHFTSWPDHGVPKFATSLISFIRRVQKGHDKDSGLPLLIHCSAGVGRTGTFIVLDAMLERIKVEGSVNVYPFLTELRSKRVLMVQTLPQYVFIHDALDELITCGETDISAGQLRTKCNVMNKVIPAKGVTGFHVQFQLLDQVSRKPEEGECSDALEHFNVSKNRYEDKLPYNMSRARLRPTGDEGSEYINASFIDGYRRRNAYIAAQSPMQSTVNDFWRMMWEFKSKVMVMLCNLNEEGQDACHPYWPAKVEQTIKYGKVLVTLTSQNSDDSDDYAIRKFTIQEESKPVTEAFTVTQYHHTEWPQHSQPPSSSCLIDMMDRITKSQMNTGNRAITVLCNDGVGRTGTFICIHAQLERLKTEGVVDFFQYTKSARIHRAGLVPEVSQFAYCHEVLADFVETFDNYANFKDV